ncbi:MAG: DUF420 domain-containing protein [Flavobacteriales bacterium]
MPQTTENQYKPFIIAASILLPVIVAILYLLPAPKDGTMFDFLPAVNATINGITTGVLITGFIAIKKNKWELHKWLMSSAIILSIIFLLCYVLYHATSETSHYGADGSIRYIYFFILISHIILAAIIVPLVLITYIRALNQNFIRHKKIARWTFPLWLYVTITGVVVYLMMMPYY